MPGRRSCTTEGFDTDVVDSPENGDLRYSLHAHKSMLLVVPDMKELSRRLTDAAKEKEGRYDGWCAKPVARTDINPRLATSSFRSAS